MPTRKEEAVVQTARHHIPLTETQLNQILAMTEKDPALSDVHDVVTMIIATGMRVREIRDLRWADVNFAQREITIKPGTPDARTIPLGDQARSALEKLRRHEPQAECVLGASPQRLLNRVSRQLATISKVVGGDRVSYQTLRRIFAVHLFNAGTDICSVMRIMGYKVQCIEKVTIL